MPVLLFASCNSNQEIKSPTSPATPGAVHNFKTLDTTINFSGYWINEAYVTSVQETKSPVKAIIPEKSCIWIPKRTLIPTGMVYGFHESGEGLVVVRKDSHYEIWDETLENKRHSILLVKDKLQIDNDWFVYLNADTTAFKNQPAILEQFLFAGDYEHVDGSVVEFTANGMVKGLEKFKTYSAFVDYVAETNPVNRMALSETQSEEKHFAYQFHNDTLLIYTLKCSDYDTNNHCLEESFGELKYRLTRKNK